MLSDSTIEAMRAQLRAHDAAAIVLTKTDNVDYACGFTSVMDGWNLIEPIAGVFIPASSKLPVTLFLPEASLISLVVAQRSGCGIVYERLRTYDMLNFCETARSQDAHLSLPEDLVQELATISEDVEGNCAPTILESIAECLQDHVLENTKVLFDDLRVANRLQQRHQQVWQDGLDVVLACRSVKQPDEIELLRESGRIADSILEYTVSQLGIGVRWSDVEKAVAKFMIDQNVDPLPGSPMLFGGSYDMVFRPDLFRTHYDRPFQGGEIAILETQGRYRGYWIDINRTAHIGRASQAYKDQHACVRKIFETLSQRLQPGCNSADISRTDNIDAAKQLAAPEKLLVVAHSVGRVPLESPVAFPGTGLHAAKEGFEVKSGMVISIDCLYFGSKLGPSHMENVFLVTAEGCESLYQFPLDLIEVL